MNHLFKILCCLILFATITFALFPENTRRTHELSTTEGHQPIPLLILKQMFNKYSKLKQNNNVDGYFNLT